MSLPYGSVTYNYTMICYCMDSMQATNSSISYLNVITNPGKSNISLASTLQANDFNITLTPEQMYKRTLTLESFGRSYFIINSTNVTNVNSSLDNNSLILNDPVCTPDWCNGRGTCYLIDKNLACDCDNYAGTNCQIDLTSYTNLVTYYKYIYSSLVNNLAIDQNGYVSKGLDNLIRGASYFINDSTFMLQVLNFVQLAQKYYINTLLSTNDCLNYYNSLLDWGIYT